MNEPQRAVSLSLQPRLTAGARLTPLGPSRWHFELPPGPPGSYRLAQLDDYAVMPRRRFPWQAPARLSLRARVSAPDLPGTWGFGFWNDPFPAFGGLSGMRRLLPSLPQAAWFFYTSPPNHLALDNALPGNGLMAMTFASPRLPEGLLLLGLPAAPLLLWRRVARSLRRVGSRVVRQAAVQLALDPTAWHTYTVDWQPDQVILQVDGAVVLITEIVPRARLGLVLWIDNQYAAFRPDGALAYGALATPASCWLEISDLEMH
jgi:hypothetical protein